MSIKFHKVLKLIFDYDFHSIQFSGCFLGIFQSAACHGHYPFNVNWFFSYDICLAVINYDYTGSGSVPGMPVMEPVSHWTNIDLVLY